MKRIALLVYGLSLWTLPIVTYLTTFAFGVKLFLVPLWELYGFWTWLGLALSLCFTGALSSGLFMKFVIFDLDPPWTMIKEYRNA